MLKVIELFAGVGAQRRALQKANIEHQVIAISEIDRYAIQAYNAIHGDTPNLGDIKKIEKLPKADLWTYSFPCTDISISGRMKGFDKGSNTGSSLLWEVQRLLEVARDNNELPRFLLMENVKNIISKKFMPKFQEWLDFLISLGYTNYYQVLNAKDYGIPQNRERVFCVSIRGEHNPFKFPQKQELKLKLKDLLEEEVDEKFYLSQKLINCFMADGTGGYPRRERFLSNIGRENQDVGNAVTTLAGSRPTDNYIIEPIPAALRGRYESDGKIKQHLEIKDDGNTNTITTVQKDNLIFVPEATKKGYALAKEGDGIYTNRVQFKRGVVQRDKIPTLKTCPNDVTVVTKDINNLISIRRLTPRECFRLMGWCDEDINRAFKIGVSDTQLYKMAGNSIVVNCLTEIFKNLKEIIENV